MTDLPFSWAQHFAAKARDLPTASSPVAALLQELDTATVLDLNAPTVESRAALQAAFDAVLDHPASTWTADVLRYRQRQLYYS